MPPIPDTICRFLRNHHVISIAACAEGKIWSASCFYVFDADAARLIVMTSKHTRHGSMLAVQPAFSATIAGQPENIAQISGIQLGGRAECLEDPSARQAALTLYYAAYPVARAMNSDVWALYPDEIKLTDNKRVFARKTHWTRHD